MGEDRYRVVDTAPYVLPDGRTWTARLCQWTEGRKAGLYFAYYQVPRRKRAPNKRRPSLRTHDEGEARQAFRTLLEEDLPAEVESAWHRGETSLDGGDPLLTELCAWYVDTVQVARGDTDRTREQNRVHFRRFTSWLADRGVETAADLAERRRLADEYVAHLLSLRPPGKTSTMRPSSVRKEVLKLRALFRAAVDQGILVAPPVRTWNLPDRDERRYDDAPDPADLRRLLERLKVGERWPSTIYRLVVFMAHVGCRPSDACGLERKHLHLDDPAGPYAMIRQHKTRHLVPVALAAGAVQAVRDELARGIDSPYVFTDRRGKPFSAGTIRISLAHHAQKLGLRLTAKSLRQAVVSWLLDQGADQEHVRRITGHRSDAIGAYVKLRRGAAHDLAEKMGALLQDPTPEND